MRGMQRTRAPILHILSILAFLARRSVVTQMNEG